jgi:hypothetical protein
MYQQLGLKLTGPDKTEEPTEEKEEGYRIIESGFGIDE